MKTISLHGDSLKEILTMQNLTNENAYLVRIGSSKQAQRSVDKTKNERNNILVCNVIEVTNN
jgi:hypothetical protein